MVTIGPRQEVEVKDQALEIEVERQVAEIMEAAETEEKQIQDSNLVTPTWKYLMPFAGVRYYSYD